MLEAVELQQLYTYYEVEGRRLFMNSPVKIWRNQKRMQSLLGKTGVIVTWTVIYVPPEGFSSFAPYPLAVVLLETGEKITSQLVDFNQEDLHVNQKVKTVLRRVMEPSTDGVIPYGIKVTPI